MNLKFVQTSQTIGDALRGVARRHGKREAIVFGEHRVTYAQLMQSVDALAAGFRDLGVQRGEHVGLILTNCLEFIYTVYALADLGAAAVPISPQSGSWELQHILGDSEAVAVVTDPRAAGTDLVTGLLELQRELPALKHIIVRGETDSDGTLSFAQLMAARSTQVPSRSAAQPSDAAIVLYTSGTTGAPKGAVHTHRTLLTALSSLIARYLQVMTPTPSLLMILPSHMKTIRRAPFLAEAVLTRVDLAQLRLLVLTPFYHVAGNFQIYLSLLTGDKLVMVDRFHPQRVLELIESERISVVFGVPPMFRAMLARSDFSNYNLSSVVLSLSGAMSVPGDLLREIKDRFGGFALNLYGATEMAATTITLPLDPVDKQEETVGHVNSLKGVEVRIVDDDRNEVEHGTVGEIAVRASMMMAGYYRRPEETARAIDEEGWYYCGDLGSIDAEGYLRVMGRRGDMIIRAGANVYPAEIENFLLGHPAIEKVAVIGLPGAAATGERVRAYVVTKPESKLTEGDVIGYCWGKIAAYKVPNEVVFVESLPVTSALRKVQHFKLRQQALAEQS